MSLLKFAKTAYRRRHRQAAFNRAISDVRRYVATGDSLPVGLADRLSYGWGNEGWSAKPLLLEFLLQEFREFRGTILECGSGLSTVLFTLIGAHTGARIISLEHNMEWHALLQSRLRSLHLDDRGLLHAPLVNHGDFDWYAEHPVVSQSSPFNLILCDGPPNSTRGGRTGLMPRMAPHIATNAIVVIDDSHRDEEAKMIANWLVDFAGKLRPEKTCATFSTLRVTSGP